MTIFIVDYPNYTTICHHLLNVKKRKFFVTFLNIKVYSLASYFLFH